jgi:hypothetical protein
MDFVKQSVKMRNLVLSLAAVVMASSASAGTIVIGDLTETAPSVTPSGGAAVNGVNCTVSASTEGCFFSVTGLAGAASFTVDFQRVNMFEQGSSVVSDLLNQTDSGGTATFWQFTSDVDGATALTPFAASAGTLSLTEDGTPQGVVTISYFGANGAPVGVNVIQIQSDAAVPEPSSGVLALFGLTGLGFVMLRRRIARAK